MAGRPLCTYGWVPTAGPLVRLPKNTPQLSLPLLPSSSMEPFPTEPGVNLSRPSRVLACDFAQNLDEAIFFFFKIADIHLLEINELSERERERVGHGRWGPLPSQMSSCQAGGSSSCSSAPCCTWCPLMSEHTTGRNLQELASSINFEYLCNCCII